MMISAMCRGVVRRDSDAGLYLVGAASSAPTTVERAGATPLHAALVAREQEFLVADVDRADARRAHP
ncbi:MAG: hypothetical protein M3411_06130, partial [Chloroflexota bacterium]|nr:hypothetical protein [Chloroflexota bacterium]